MAACLQPTNANLTSDILLARVPGHWVERASLERCLGAHTSKLPPSPQAPSNLPPSSLPKSPPKVPSQHALIGPGRTRPFSIASFGPPILSCGTKGTYWQSPLGR